MHFYLFSFFYEIFSCTNGRKAFCHRKNRPYEKPIAVVTVQPEDEADILDAVLNRILT